MGKKRIVQLTVCILAFVYCFCIFASATENVIDLSKTGSILITMKHNGTVVPGGSLTLYRVASVVVENGNSSFVYTERWRGCPVSLADPGKNSVAVELVEYMKNRNIPGTTKTIDSKGTIKFDNLQLGLYLLVQTDAANGYQAVSPFLVTVPYRTEAGYVYNVDASPKVDLEREPQPSTPTTPPDDPDIPYTGQSNWLVPILVVAGIAVFSLGWMLCLKRGKRDEA